MKQIAFFIGLFAIVISFNSCDQKSSQQITGVTSYDALYKDSFEILLHSETPPYSLADTIYTEMYIALKAMKSDKTNQCAKMVCDKVDQLLKIDTIKVNQIDYLEAKLIAQAILKDKEGIIKSLFQQFKLYPENSFEHLSSLGSLYLAINQKDSAAYYLNRCLQISKENLNTSNNATIEKDILGVLHSLVLLNKDQEAKSFINEQLNHNPSDEIKKLLHSIDEDYEGFKKNEWQSVEALFKNL